MKNKLGIFSLAALMATPGAAQAHTATEIGGGFIHPINGADHLMHLFAGAPAGLLIASGIAIAGVALAAAIPILRRRQSYNNLP